MIFVLFRFEPVIWKLPKMTKYCIKHTPSTKGSVICSKTTWWPTNEKQKDLSFEIQSLQKPTETTFSQGSLYCIFSGKTPHLIGVDAPLCHNFVYICRSSITRTYRGFLLIQCGSVCPKTTPCCTQCVFFFMRVFISSPFMSLSDWRCSYCWSYSSATRDFHRFCLVRDASTESASSYAASKHETMIGTLLENRDANLTGKNVCFITTIFKST